MSHIVGTLTEVGRHFSRTLRTAQRWQRGGMPKARSGYDLEEIEIWLRGRAYLGATLRQLEADAQAQALFELAVQDLRRGLLNLCESFIKARGKTRARLVDQAVKGILTGCIVQVDLWERGGGAAPGGGQNA